MANLGMKNGTYLARFRLGGREYKRSLKTADRKSAELAMHRVEAVLHQLALGYSKVPAGVDPGDYVVSGGTLEAAPPAPARPPAPSLEEAAREFLSNLGHLAPSSRYTAGVHLRNLRRALGGRGDAALDRLERRDLEGSLQKRLRQVSQTTVSKERD